MSATERRLSNRTRGPSRRWSDNTTTTPPLCPKPRREAFKGLGVGGVGQGAGGENDRVYLMGVESPDVVELLHRIPVGARHEEPVVLCMEAILEALDDLPEVWIRDVVHDYADRL